MKRRVFHLFLIFTLLQLTSCAGYHFNTNNNPLIGYDIHSVAVPMFINRTNIAGLNSLMTKEIIFSLNDFSGLRVYSGDATEADAVLIGVLESEDQFNKTFTTAETLFTDGDDDIKNSIGQRTPFYYSIKTNYQFKLQVYLIRRPTPLELAALKNNLGGGAILALHPKIVLNEIIPVSGTFTRAVADTTSKTSGGVVNFTKNKGFEFKSLQEACSKTASTFKQVVLNAF